MTRTLFVATGSRAWLALALVCALPIGSAISAAQAATLWYAVPASSMASNRVDHAASLLPGGKVLVTGGMNGASALVGAEVYDPAAGVWTGVAPLLEARGLHTSTSTANGQVLVVGGFNGAQTIGTAVIYDPAAGSWRSAGNFNARYSHTATLLSNAKLLVTGGSKDGNFIQGGQLFSPAVNSWSGTGQTLPAGRNQSATLLRNGQVLVTGGSAGAASLKGSSLYNPLTANASPAAPMNTARAWHTATLLGNGRVLVAGGVDGTNSLGSAEIYDPATGTWSPAASMLAARYHHTATLLTDGEVLVTGGFDGTNSLGSAEIYDPAAGAWRLTAGGLLTARRGHTASLLADGSVLVAGGSQGGVALASVEIFKSFPVIPTVTSLADSGPGSLREVIRNATSGDVITFATSGTIVLTSGEIPVTNNLTVAGPGAADLRISGNDLSRVFNFAAGTTNTVSGVSIINGRAPSGSDGIYDGTTHPPAGGEGAGGGGLMNGGTLTLTGCILSSNHAGTGGQGSIGSPARGTAGTGGRGGAGGAIFSSGRLGLTGCALVANGGGAGGVGGSANLGGFGGSGGGGGAILSLGDLALSACTFRLNTGGVGGTGGAGLNGGDSDGAGGGGGEGGSGGAISSSGSLVLTSSSFDLNASGDGGSGGLGFSPGVGGFGGGGGAIFVSGLATMTNSTFAHNRSGTGGDGAAANLAHRLGGTGGPGGLGGAVWAPGGATLVSCTLVANAASAGGSGGSGASPVAAGSGGSGGGIYGKASLGNTLVAQNTCAASQQGADIFGAVDSQGYNLIGTGDGVTGIADGVNHDLAGTDAAPLDPTVGPLQDNGGATFTMALLEGSLASESGDDALQGTDQRGSPRRQGDHVDIGAFESSFTYPSPLLISQSATTTATNAETRLRTVELTTVLIPERFSVLVSIEFGLTSAYGFSRGAVALPAGSAPAQATLQVTLSPGFTYHWRAVVTNRQGVVTRSHDQAFVLGVPGDRNDDGVLDQTEFNAILTTLNGALSKLNAAGYYTTNQIQSLDVGTLLLTKNPATGRFTLSIGVQKATGVNEPFLDMPLNGPGTSTSIDGQGRLQFQFPAPDNAAFFRLQSR